MAASAVTAANAAPSTLQQELPVATRRRDSASVKPMSPVSPDSSNMLSHSLNAPNAPLDCPDVVMLWGSSIISSPYLLCINILVG